MQDKSKKILKGLLANSSFSNNRVPHLAVIGNYLFLFFFIFFASISYLIQYPDIVLASAVLNTSNGPKNVFSQIDGRLKFILVKNNQQVKKEEYIAYIESVANPYSIARLKYQIDSLLLLIDQNRINEISSFYPLTIKSNLLTDLGELQSNYQIFIESFTNFKEYLNSGFYQKKRSTLEINEKLIRNLNQTLLIQKSLIEQDIELSNENLKVSGLLLNEKVISEVEFRIEKSKNIAKLLLLPQINASIISNQEKINNIFQEISGIERDFTFQKNTFIQALLTFKSTIELWEQKYIIKAPVDGVINFVRTYEENQEIQKGSVLFIIEQRRKGYFVELYIPKNSFGKVKLGQEVLLKFHAYPYQQHGIVLGRIQYISNFPIDSGYYAMVSLKNDLNTTYNKKIPYLNYATAQAEIVTDKLRLIDRFYNNFR